VPNSVSARVKMELRKTVVTLITQGFHTFISGMALGVDQWAAEIVLELKVEYPHIKLIAAVPFEGQETAWFKQAVERWRGLLQQSDEVVYVCEPGYAPWKMQHRNKWMVDHSSIIVAVWDGSEGGTGNCVRYAETTDCQIIRIQPTKQECQ
jgi:uncharacterized phage-like protein YoqJ